MNGGVSHVESVPESLFKITLELARFSGINVLDLRSKDAEEVLYLFRCLSTFNFDEETPTTESCEPLNNGLSVEYVNGVKRVQRFADEVDWFD